MQTRTDKPSTGIVQYFADFQKVAENYLSSKAKLKKSVFSFFKPRFVEEDIANSLLELISKISFSMGFPNIAFSKKIAFLEGCTEIYSTLKKSLHKTSKRKNQDSDLVEFEIGYVRILKRVSYSLLSGQFENSDEINPNYLDYYIASIFSGLGCPTNEEILKKEILTVLHDHSTRYPNNIVMLFSESIKHDNKGINQYAENRHEKLRNLLAVIKLFQTTLIERKEYALVAKINSVLDRASEYNEDIGLKLLSHSPS
ncbi:MAG: hypothetical protein ABI370_08550 [Gammaproteobacteria bacterium]